MTEIIPLPSQAIIRPGEWDLERILAGQISASSLGKYRQYLSNFREWCKAEGLDPLDPQAFASWRDHLVIDTAYAANTINTQMAGIKRIMEEAGLRGYILQETAEAFDKVAGVSRKALKKRARAHARVRITPEEMRRLCEAPNPETLPGLRDCALLHLLASSGVRISEAVSLQRDQIRRKGKGWELHILGKTEEEEPRQAPLSREAKGWVDKWIKARGVSTPWVFTSFRGRGAKVMEAPLSEVSGWEIVRRYAGQVAQGYEREGDPRPHLGHIKPHDFRRFVGTTLARVSVKKAQIALGHQNANTTLTHYVLEELEGEETEGIY